MSVYAYSDIFVRYLLGDPRNGDLLLSFINAVNEDYGFVPLKSVFIKNPFNFRNLAEEKDSVIDIKAADEEGQQYDIEVQLEGNEHYINRSLYYWAKLYHSQLEEGDSYSRLKPVICINLINFILFRESSKVHSCFLLKEKKEPERELTQNLLIHFIELNKFEKDSKFMLSFDRWIAFFRYEGIREEIMAEIIKKDPILEKAHRKYANFTRSKRLMELYNARMKQQADEKTRIEEAEKRGHRSGKIEIARNMIARNMDSEMISECTGLSPEEIQKLKKEMSG